MTVDEAKELNVGDSITRQDLTGIMARWEVDYVSPSLVVLRKHDLTTRSFMFTDVVTFESWRKWEPRKPFAETINIGLDIYSVRVEESSYTSSNICATFGDRPASQKTLTFNASSWKKIVELIQRALAAQPQA